ncbi:MAG: hypothetical protein AB7P03_01925 [Kofleriaceae bacterium]
MPAIVDAAVAPSPPSADTAAQPPILPRPPRSTVDELAALVRKTEGDLRKAQAELRAARTDDDKQRVRMAVSDHELERKQLRALLDAANRTRNENGVINDALAPGCLENPLKRGCSNQ